LEPLFESRIEIGRIDGKLRWVQQRANVCDQPVLNPDNSGDGAGASIYGTVLHDAGRYRMWYQGWPRDWDGANSSIVCYAESDDGVVWRKPGLKLDDRFPGRQNVTDLGLHAPAVFIDPDSPPSHRYRATGHTSNTNVGANRNIEGSGYRTAHSSDGLHWTLDQPEPTWPGSDVITSIYHPGQKRGIVALKQNVRSGGIRRRAIWNADFRDGQWCEPGCAIVPDQLDDICALTRGYASGDYYGMAMQPTGQGMAGFIWQLRHALPRTQSSAGDGAGVFGAVDISLAYQPDERSAWIHAPGRLDFLSNADIPWRPGGCIYTASAPVEVGDEHRLYLCATYPHGWYVSPTWEVLEDVKARVIQRGFSAIGYAHWPRHRLFGYRAEPTGSVELNLGIRNAPFQLFLNCEVHHPDGHVTVAVHGSETQTCVTCQPMTRSTLAGQVTWQSGPVIKPNPVGPTLVNISLNEATAWAYDVRVL